jgi:hypothetical protein
LDLLQAEIEKIESGIYDCEAIIEGKGTGLTEGEVEEASRRKPGLEQERETNVLKRAAILKDLFGDALNAVIPICKSDKELRRHLQD